MNCDETRELLAGYALSALDPEEHAAVEAHLLQCREHDAELTELRATRLALGLLEAAAEPSGRLGARIADIARAPERLDARRGLASLPAWAAAAAVLVLTAGFGGGWALGRASNEAPAVVSSAPFATPVAAPSRYSYAMRGTAGQLVRLSGMDGSDTVTVTMAGIGQLPPGRAYQLWAIREGRWLSIGACNTDEAGWWLGDFTFSVRPGEEVAVTVEPAEGSPKPSSPALLRGRF